MGRLLLPLLLVAVLLRCCSSLNLTECNIALGMESGDIQDEAIQASSTHNEVNVGPQNGRLNRELKSGAWCPERQISVDVHEYLEIHLTDLHVITAVATQGRFGNGHGQEYAEEYLIEYWRPGMTTWKIFADRKGIQIFQGNVNTYTVVKRSTDPPIIATKVRFVPHSVHLRTVCMRVEVYGCPFLDGLVSYSMPQGDRRGPDLDLSDRTYDGILDKGHLRDGLGQLLDGRRGNDNLRSDVDGLGRGYDWVGWKKDHGSFLLPAGRVSDAEVARQVEMLFTFDVVRNFSAAHFHCSNAYSRGVQVFSSAVVSFSMGGIFFGPPLRLSHTPDLTVERSRSVTLHLYYNIGRQLRIDLHFAAPWILISEVSFDSVPALGNFTEEEPPVAPSVAALDEDALGTNFVGLVIGVLAASILLLFLVILAVVARHQRRKNHLQGTVSVNIKDISFSLYDQVDGDDSYKEPNDLGSSYAKAYPKDFVRKYAVSNSQKLCTSTPLARLPCIRGVCGTSVYQPISYKKLPVLDNSSQQKELPRISLRHLENLGGGEFGEVHLCRIPRGSTSHLVSVRILRFGSDSRTKARFLDEARILSLFRDPNVACVVGLYQEKGLPCLLVEHTEIGDLWKFLRRHSPENAKATETNVLSYGCLIYLSLQVASGMKHLSSLGLVHTDLAARNCLVEGTLVVKISDLASSRVRGGLYSSHYCKVDGQLLPIRWMAPETLLQGKFTSKSDVWSYGITLWEILTFARRLPFCELTDQQLVAQAGICAPSPPQQCPREVCDLMRECWKRTDTDRPHFGDIHLFLQRKNLGYTPRVVDF